MIDIESEPEPLSILIDIESEPEPLSISAPKQLPSKPAIPLFNAVAQETHCDASTLMYMSHINAIFNDMILNREEKFTSENIGQYTKFLKETMTYFGEMKILQTHRRLYKEKDWETHFLDRITWRNLRGGVCGFVHFSAYLLRELPDKIEGWHHVPMLFSNQSPLEGQFSAFRSSNHDYANNFGGEVTNKCTRQVNAAQARSHSYSSEDGAKESDKFVTGTELFTRYQKQSNKRLETWLQKRRDFKKRRVNSNQQPMTSNSPLFQSTKINKLANTMNTHCSQTGFVDKLMNCESFQR